MIKNFLEDFRSRLGCITFGEAEEKSIEAANNFLSDCDFAKIPAEYETFLKLTNGFIYNGIEFFGTNFHYREEKKYYFPDLITINKHYKKYNFFENKIIIGRLSESILLYDENTKYYGIVDRVKLRSRSEFENFEELLSTLIGYCNNQ